MDGFASYGEAWPTVACHWKFESRFWNGCRAKRSIASAVAITDSVASPPVPTRRRRSSGIAGLAANMTSPAAWMLSVNARKEFMAMWDKSRESGPC